MKSKNRKKNFAIQRNTLLTKEKTEFGAKKNKKKGKIGFNIHKTVVCSILIYFDLSFPLFSFRFVTMSKHLKMTATGEKSSSSTVYCRFEYDKRHLLLL